MTADPLTALRSIPSQSAAEMSRGTEYGWLEERVKALRAELAEIVKGSAGDDHTEAGIANLQAAIDDFDRRVTRLDEGE